jgi:hypothetical protein
MRMRKGALAGLAAALLASLLIAAVPGVGSATEDHPRGHVLTAMLNGEEEVPGPGDPDGSGFAKVALGKQEVCFQLEWEGIDAPHAAHIHAAPTGVAGDIVVGFFMEETPLPASINQVGGCVEADRDLIRDIRRHPDQYYVNIHNPAFPAGALRGQLER